MRKKGISAFAFVAAVLLLVSVAYSISLRDLFWEDSRTVTANNRLTEERTVTERAISAERTVSLPSRSEEDVFNRFGNTSKTREIVQKEGSDNAYYLLQTTPDLTSVSIKYAGVIENPGHPLSTGISIETSEGKTTYTVYVFIFPKMHKDFLSQSNAMNMLTNKISYLNDLKIVFSDYDQAMKYYQVVSQGAKNGKILMTFTTKDCVQIKDSNIVSCTVHVGEDSNSVYVSV